VKLARPVLWILISFFLPVGLILGFSIPMSATPAQRIVWVSTGWFVLIWICTLFVRVLREKAPADEMKSSPESVEEGKAHG
jgi:hypothetical protein